MSFDATISRARAFANAHMTDRCTISAPVSVSDGAGGTTITYRTTQTDVPYYAYPASRRRPTGSPETVTAGRVQSVDDWIVMLPAGTTVAPTSRLALKDDRTVEVTHIEALGTVELFRSVSCVEVA